MASSVLLLVAPFSSYMEQQQQKRVSGEAPDSPSKLMLNIPVKAKDHGTSTPLSADTSSNPVHPKLASETFLKYAKDKCVPELDYNDFEYICHVADGGYGSVFRYRRKDDGKLVAMKFFGMVSDPSQQYIEKEEIVKDWELNRLQCTAKV